ncbi:hypothetical protein QJQ45_007884 [Haematococcus lacustris]|nr:hypothetical protein QJQ45_007884 [Haematococcus lacustris]
MHTLMSGVSAAGLEEGAVMPSEVVEARLYQQLVLWVEACSKRALLASLLLGLMVRGCFTRVTVLGDGLELLEEIPAEDTDIPNFAERNLYLYTASLQRYREYAAMTLVTWPAMWAELSKPRWSNARFRLYRYKQSTVAMFWAETVRGARVRCNSAATGRPLALAYGAAGFSGTGTIGSKAGSAASTSRVSSARTNVVAGQAESFRWLRPVRSMATRSRIRGLMCSTSTGIRFYDRDVSAALNIRRIAAIDWLSTMTF